MAAPTFDHECETCCVARRRVNEAAFVLALGVVFLTMTLGTYLVLLNLAMCNWGDPCGGRVRPAAVLNLVGQASLLALLASSAIWNAQPALRRMRSWIGSAAIIATAVLVVVACYRWAASSVPP